MPNQYAKDQFWKLYKNISQELKDALFAEETGNNIHDVCERNKIMEKLGDIVDLVGQVLVGVLPPEDFQETLENELELETDIAKKVAQEISRFIFYPVRTELEKLYQTAAAPTGEIAPEKTKESLLTQEEESTEPKKDDTYREPIE